MVLYTILSLIVTFFLSVSIIEIAGQIQEEVWWKYVDQDEYYQAMNDRNENFEVVVPRPNQSKMSRMDWHISETCDFLRTYGVLLFSFAGCGIAVSLFYKNKLKRPIQELKMASQMIAEEDLDFHMAYENEDEMGMLCREFERMRGQLEENNRTETTILIVDGRKKVARVLVRIAKLWDLTVDAPEEGFDLFIGEKRLVKILTGNGDYQISIPEGADKFLEVGELSGQVIPLTAKFETGADPVNITITDKKGKTITIPVVVNIVDLTLKSNEATFAEPDAESQYISIERGNGGYSFTYQVGDGEPTTDATIVEATEKENLITLKPKARGDVKVIVTDQKGSVEEISVKVNPYNLKLENEATSLIIGGYEASTEIAITRGNGDYKLAQLTDDNKTYLKTAELITEDGATKLKLTGKKLGTTTLELSDAAGQKLTLPVYVNPVCYRMEYDVCFKIDIKKYAESHSEVKSMNQLTFEVVFYPTYTRSMQSFIGLESVFLLRAEAKDVNPRFEIATKINGKSDPRFRSQQTIYCDDSEGGRKTPGKWYHIAIVYDGTKSSTKEAYKMYINGVRETLTPADNSYEDCAPNSSLNLTDVGGNDKALLIGRSGDSYRVGYCKVYQARMWKRALDESEIKANMCKILNAEEHSDLMGYWVFSKGVGGTTVFENWGNGGSGLDAQVCLQNISENKPAWGAELPATYNGDKSRFEPIECPHSY